MTWPLPVTAYVPGLTPRPEDSPAFDASAAAPAVTDPEDWQGNATYLYGFTLYRAGFFWEAHEVWEPVWMHARANARERALMRGLIQLANACLKLRMERPRAAIRLAGEAAHYLAEAGSAPLMGLEPHRLAQATSDWADEIESDLEDALARRPDLAPKSAL